MEILKAALRKCSCYSRVIYTFVNSAAESHGSCRSFVKEAGGESFKKDTEAGGQISPNLNVCKQKCAQGQKNEDPAFKLLEGKQVHLLLMGAGGKLVC